MPYQHAFPPPQGLYDPTREHDACGVAFVATLTGEASHDIVAKALTALRNLDHRGAAGAEVGGQLWEGRQVQVHRQRTEGGEPAEEDGQDGEPASGQGLLVNTHEMSVEG